MPGPGPRGRQSYGGSQACKQAAPPTRDIHGGCGYLPRESESDGENRIGKSLASLVTRWVFSPTEKKHVSYLSTGGIFPPRVPRRAATTRSRQTPRRLVNSSAACERGSPTAGPQWTGLWAPATADARGGRGTPAARDLLNFSCLPWPGHPSHTHSPPLFPRQVLPSLPPLPGRSPRTCPRGRNGIPRGVSAETVC